MHPHTYHHTYSDSKVYIKGKFMLKDILILEVQTKGEKITISSAHKINKFKEHYN